MARRALLFASIVAGFILPAAAQSNSSSQAQSFQRSISQAQQQEWACRDEIRQRTQGARMLRISPAVTAANALTKIQPDTAGIVMTGNDSVYVQVVIAPDGGVACARALEISGAESTELRSKAVDAARQWKFKPYLLNGNPVFVDGVLSFNFDIS